MGFLPCRACANRCESDPERRFPVQAQWPTLLFNQGHCACWGATPPLDGLASAANATAASWPAAAASAGVADGTVSADGAAAAALPFGLLLAAGGNAGGGAAAAAAVSLVPAGRKRKAPTPGSDPRVSSFRLCPQVEKSAHR